MHRRLIALSAAFALGIASPCAWADILEFEASLDGASEFPPNVTTGTGSAFVTYDDVLHTMRVEATFQDLLGTTSAAHIHTPIPDPPGDPTAGVATQTPSFSGFPLGVTSGVMDTTFDLTLASSWNASYITAKGGTPALAEAAFFAEMTAGKAYFNIHTSFDGSGEIRGFFSLIPEPAAASLAGLGLGALGAVRRRRG